MESKRTLIRDNVPYGIYVWQLPSGEILGDDEGHLMLIQSDEHNQANIKKLAQAAKYYGFEEGRAVFWHGRRPVTDDEYENQVARFKAGLVPDPLDIGAIQDEYRRLRRK